ncbi:MAG: hypothetical protein EAZ57_03280 [Cytophagales bacterium]|nr:MAG: hypothetical protein EAZ67_03745 [Cytophagales bacterium]TAF61486.1 MAG: hypothetical protein EAZ57_03280 [Cytophagales bacterium]
MLLANDSTDLKPTVTLSVLKFAGSVLFFFVGLRLLASSFSWADVILVGLETEPFVCFFSALILSAVLQSHALSVCVLCALGANHYLGLEELVYMLLGSNLGSTISGSLSRLGRFSGKKEFKRGLTVLLSNHFVKLLMVLFFFPLEYYWKVLSRSAAFIQLPSIQWFENWPSPLAVVQLFFLFLGLFLLHVSFLLYRQSSTWVLLSQSSLIPAKETFASEYKTFILGIQLAFLYQSSGAARAQVLSSVARRDLNLKKVFPFILGNNLGITGAGLLAAVCFLEQPHVMALVILNILINTVWSGLFMIFSWLREMPIEAAKWISDTSTEYKLIGFTYVLLVFFLLPFLFIFGSVKGFDLL